MTANDTYYREQTKGGRISYRRRNLSPRVMLLNFGGQPTDTLIVDGNYIARVEQSRSGVYVTATHINIRFENLEQMRQHFERVMQ